MATWMGITWEIQQSAPTDALKVVFTLMSLTDSDTRSLWLDPGMQTHANKTHKTLMYKKKKKKEGDFIIYIEQQRNQATECPSAWECIISLGRQMTRGKLGGHGSRASGVNYTGFQHKMAWGSAALHNRVIHLPSRLNGCLNLAGAIGQTVLCWVSQQLNWLLFFFSVLKTEKMLFWWRFYMFGCF